MTDQKEWLDYKKYLEGIRPADQEALEAAKKYNDGLLKPLGSLGKLEDIAIQLAGITGKIHNSVERKCTVVMCADNGICAEGVSGSPQAITLQQSVNIANGLGGISVLSAHCGSDVRVVDLGIDGDYENDRIVNRKIKRGTDNFAKGPAMSREEAETAIGVGIEMVRGLVKEGYQLLGTGEMGIGNTSSTSAVLMAMTGLSAEEAVGKGGGLTDEALAHKKKVLAEAIALNRPNAADPVDVISKVGGLDIAGMMGCFIGAAYYRVPIVIDGVISALSALAACRLKPEIKDFLIPSHCSQEPAYVLIMKELGLEPMLLLNMRLGEGSGCALEYFVVSAACAMMNNMGSFEQVSIDETYRIDIRGEADEK